MAGRIAFLFLIPELSVYQFQRLSPPQKYPQDSLAGGGEKEEIFFWNFLLYCIKASIVTLDRDKEERAARKRKGSSWFCFFKPLPSFLCASSRKTKQATWLTKLPLRL